MMAPKPQTMQSASETAPQSEHKPRSAFVSESKPEFDSWRQEPLRWTVIQDRELAQEASSPEARRRDARLRSLYHFARPLCADDEERWQLVQLLELLELSHGAPAVTRTLGLVQLALCSAMTVLSRDLAHFAAQRLHPNAPLLVANWIEAEIERDIAPRQLAIRRSPDLAVRSRIGSPYLELEDFRTAARVLFVLRLSNPSGPTGSTGDSRLPVMPDTQVPLKGHDGWGKLGHTPKTLVRRVWGVAAVQCSLRQCAQVHTQAQTAVAAQTQSDHALMAAATHAVARVTTHKAQTHARRSISDATSAQVEPSILAWLFFVESMNALLKAHNLPQPDAWRMCYRRQGQTPVGTPVGTPPGTSADASAHRTGNDAISPA